MKSGFAFYLLGALVLLAVGGAGGVAFYNMEKSLKASEKKASASYETSYIQLEDGTILIQDVPATAVEDIEPAAGSGDQPQQGGAPRMKYDPLTQTFRIQTR